MAQMERTVESVIEGTTESPPVVSDRPLSLGEMMRMGVTVEIINERIVEKVGAGGLHHIIVGNIFRILDAFNIITGLGAVFVDGLIYLMHSDEKHLKNSFVPDVSFIRRENIPADWNVEKLFPGVPDLAIDVISPGDDAEDVQEKVRVYLDKGTQQVWLTFPKTKELHQYLAGEIETVRVYKGSQQIDAEALFPGIEGLTTDAIFAMPAWMSKTPDTQQSG